MWRLKLYTTWLESNVFEYPLSFTAVGSITVTHSPLIALTGLRHSSFSTYNSVCFIAKHFADDRYRSFPTNAKPRLHVG